MCAWQVHSYGGTEELQLSCSVRDPVISKPDDVLVNVAAASVNPIDVAMMSMCYSNVSSLCSIFLLCCFTVVRTLFFFHCRGLWSNITKQD